MTTTRTLGEYVEILLDRRWAVVAVLGIVLSGVGTYLVLAPPVYVAESVVRVVVAVDDRTRGLRAGTRYTELAARSCAEVMTRPSTLLPAAGVLGMDVAEVADGLTTRVAGDSGFVEVTASASSAVLAARKADAVAGAATTACDGLFRTRSSPDATLTLSRRAAEPSSAAAPRRRLVLTVGVLVGGLAGVTTALLLDWSAPRVGRRGARASRLSGWPVLAVLGRRHLRTVVEDGASVVPPSAALTPVGLPLSTADRLPAGRVVPWPSLMAGPGSIEGRPVPDGAVVLVLPTTLSLDEFTGLVQGASRSGVRVRGMVLLRS